MTGLDWEKQNRKENTEPSDYAQAAAQHARKRQSQKAHLASKKARLIALERKLLEPYKHGIAVGEERERQRIIKLIEQTLLMHTDQKFFIIRSITGEQQ